MTSFVTRNVDPDRGRVLCQCGKPLPKSSTGRPAKFCSAPCRVAAHRRKQLQPVIGAGIEHRRYGFGVITQQLLGGHMIVAFRTPDGRIWRELSPDEVSIVRRPRKLPKWVNPRARTQRPSAFISLANLEESVVLATVDDYRITDVPLYKSNRRPTMNDYESGEPTVSRPPLRRNFLKAVNNRLANLVARAKGMSE